MSKILRQILIHISGDFSVDNRERDTFKIYLIYMFSIVGFLFTFSMGVLGLGTSESTTLLTCFSEPMSLTSQMASTS